MEINDDVMKMAENDTFANAFGLLVLSDYVHKVSHSEEFAIQESKFIDHLNSSTHSRQEWIEGFSKHYVGPCKKIFNEICLGVILKNALQGEENE